ncbi:hypothetical protein CAP51_11570 [Acinetobacter populi]|uniref:Prepilin-type cleavage/methylation domain-containing protein n=1 Tax=Acinetobacter populi TaxID=1582270 RepID=A0A1Z9YWL8_9GAMM|nr:hypothetical protein CAP51_11570 [Acinetobacter populi]
MIVISIIGILALIAIPLYLAVVKKSAVNACFYEVRTYSNIVYISLSDLASSISLPKSSLNSCVSVTDASTWTNGNAQKIVAKVKNYNDVTIECDLISGSVQCIVD